MAPGERPAILAPRSGGEEEGDRRLVHRIGVRPEAPADLLGAEDPRALGEEARLERSPGPGLRGEPQPPWRPPHIDVPDEARLLDPPEDPLRPACAGLGEADQAELLGGECPMLGDRSDHLGARLGHSRSGIQGPASSIFVPDS